MDKAGTFFENKPSDRTSWRSALEDKKRSQKVSRGSKEKRK